MPLAPGARLGPYEIVSALGAGGMGEVYKARDTRLDRTVAVKVLPASAAADPDARARFEREARAVAALDHPHICAIFDIGREAGVDFIVMQYLEGETLASRLQKGPLPLDQVIRYAIEIADALDKTHRQGVVHRDLKPANVMLTKTGARLLDFGLARLQPVAGAIAGMSAVATEAPSLTAAGTILGTLQYMAPEQLEGIEADARTDIFALGAVIYETATGRKAFAGKSQASVISAIMSGEPLPIATLQPMTPATLDHVVATCLAKDPEERWQSARDIERELRWIAAADTSTSATLMASGKSRPRLVATSVAIVMAAAASTITWIASSRSRTTSPPPVTRFSISLPAGKELPGFNAAPVAISPDGRTIAYLGASPVGSQMNVAAAAAGSQLYLRRVDQFGSAVVADANRSDQPLFSLDGQWILFRGPAFSMNKVSVSGGAAQMVVPSGVGQGYALADDGSVVTVAAGGVLVRTPAGGGPAQALLSPDRTKGEKAFRWPQMLPGSRAILITVATGDIASFDDARIEVLDISSGNRRVVVQGGTYGRYVPTGHVVYARAGSLLAVPFDVRRLAPTGPPVSVLDDVVTDPLDGNAAFAISQSGTLVYAPGGARRYSASMVWVDRSGHVEPVADIHRSISGVALSPNEARIAVNLEGANGTLWMYDVRLGTLTPFVTRQFNNNVPRWTPDGKHLTFRSDREPGPQVLFWQAADGAGPAERLTHQNYQERPTDWSPDGRNLFFARQDPKTGTDLWLLSSTDGKVSPILQTSANEDGAVLSPDGRWLAYASDQSGRFEVYVRSFPDVSRMWPVSSGGGGLPRWSRDGRELYFRNGDNLDQMLAVEVSRTVTDFVASKPKVLFTGPYGFTYDVALDGRFLMIKPEPQAFTQVNVVENWFTELQQRVPTR